MTPCPDMTSAFAPAAIVSSTQTTPANATVATLENFTVSPLDVALMILYHKIRAPESALFLAAEWINY
jgi:hypothetical protein